MEKLKRERWKLLHSVQNLLEGPMIFLGFLWLILLIWELIAGLPKVMEYASLTIWIIFIFDFLLRLVLAPEKITFIKKNWLTIISLIVPALRVFRMLRVIRLMRGLRGIRFIRVVSSLNRSMRSLNKTMSRRGFGYVVALSAFVTFGGAAGMFAIEQGNAGFTSYSHSLWWTAMRLITAGSDANPITPEGRVLAFLIAMYGYAVFGYVTATIATFFIGRDAEENTPMAGAKDIEALRQEVAALTKAVHEQNIMNRRNDTF